MRLQAVIFDLDGVLVDTARFHTLGWRRLADERGVPFDGAFNERFKGVSRMECARMLFPDERDEKRLTELADRKNRYFLENVETLTPRDLYPGVTALIKDLKKSNIRIAVASASKNAPRILERLGIAALFDAVVDGSHTVNSKPAPDGFLLAAKKMNVPPSDCAVVEDAAAGIAAARAAGMRSVGLGACDILGKADKVVPRFCDITLGLLKSLFPPQG
jgi:beta-phosphoglucomutase